MLSSCPIIPLNFFIIFTHRGLPYLPQKLHCTSLTKSALHAPRGNTGSNKCALQQVVRPQHISVVYKYDSEVYIGIA